MFVKLSIYSAVHTSLGSNQSHRKSLVLSQAYHFLLVSDGLCEVLQWPEKKSPFVTCVAQASALVTQALP